MNGKRISTIFLILIVLLVGGIGVLLFNRERPRFVPVPGPKQAWYYTLRDAVRTALMRPSDWKVEVTGTTGTAVVVGYEIDRSRTGIFRGIAPTNFTLRVRHCLYYAVKNVGITNAALGIRIDGGDTGCPFVPPFYGTSGQKSIRPGGGGASWAGGLILNPTDWPETLPPGMTEDEAKKHDFARELSEAKVQYFQALIAQDRTNENSYFGLAMEYKTLGKPNAAAAALEKFFTIDYPDPVILNAAAYYYAEVGGTNLDRAYEVALKANDLDRQSGHPMNKTDISDTLGWISIKRGDYRQAVDLIRPLVRQPIQNNDPVILFHLGMAYYMLMQEDAAREFFEKAVSSERSFEEREQAKRCLEVMDIKEREPQPKLVAKLKARLAEFPDDPVALSRLAGMHEQTPNATNGPVVAPTHRKK